MNESRRFLSTVIASGLDFEVLSPAEIFEHITMEVLAHHLPVSMKTRLLKASLEADAMTATLILDTLGVDAIAEHAPAPLLWQCVAGAANRSLGRPSDAPQEVTAPAGASPVVTEMPLSAAPERSDKKRKPNRSARVRAGATSLSSQGAAAAPSPVPDSEDSAFEVDTRVGGDPSVSSLDGIDDGTFDPLDEVTSHGQKT